MTKRLLVAGLFLAALGAPAGAADPAPAGQTPSAPAHAGLERLKKLAGTWVEADKDGKPTDQVVSVIKVIGAGSTVHETLFPGQPHEMVSVYHLDGSDLVMTHYCALGNQPKMKADRNAPANKIVFQFAGGTNFDPAKDKHMHGGTLTFVDDDHIEFSGEAWENGKPSPDHCPVMKLVRKK